MLARSQQSGRVHFEFVNYRDFASNASGRVDDRPYGGGPGMVLQPQIIAKALRSIQGLNSAHVIHLAPSGSPLTAKRARELSELQHLILICGHYEGIDQRAIDAFAHEEISIGDYVLTSGCPAALVLADALMRFLPGSLGHPDSAQLDSYEKGLLESPHYTRPPIFEKKEVPSILLSGDHEAIITWKELQALEKTARIRPDLYSLATESLKSGQSELVASDLDLHREAQNSSARLLASAQIGTNDIVACARWYSRRPFHWTWITSNLGRAQIANVCVEFKQVNAPITSPVIALTVELPGRLFDELKLSESSENCTIDKTHLEKIDDKGVCYAPRQIAMRDPSGVKWICQCAQNGN